MQLVASPLELDEVISPELVLVDPELAKIARRRLQEVPEWRPQAPPRPSTTPMISAVTAPVTPAETAAHVPTRALRTHVPRATRATAAALPLLLLGALVLAMVASEVRAQFLDPVASLEPASVPSPPLPAASAHATATWVPTRREVEVRTLALLADGRTAAPPALRDNRLGLLANNVRIACRRVGQTASFTCTLGVGPSSSREWLLTVVVARGGTEALTWHGRVPAR